MVEALFAFGHVFGLRGPEEILLKIEETRENKKLAGGLVRLPFVGILKGDSSPGTHYTRDVPVTDTEVNIAECCQS